MTQAYSKIINSGIFLIAILTSSCSSAESNKTHETVQKTPYVLKRDIRNCATELNEGDTLSLDFDLSVCESFQYINVDIVKQSSAIQLNIKTKNFTYDTILNKSYHLDDFKLDSILYIEILDSLYLIEYEIVGDIKIKDGAVLNPRADLTISYLKDTLFLEDTLGLIAKLEFNEKLRTILRNEFPEVKLFIPLQELMDSLRNNPDIMSL